MSNRISYLIKEIVERDDQHAFKELYDIYSPKLLSFAGSLTQSVFIAEEVVSDVFVNIWKNRKMLPAVKNISYYLHTAVKNTAFNYIKKQKNRAETFLQEDKVPIPIAYTTPETELIHSDNLQQIIDAIKGLPQKCQLIFRLAKEENLSYKEIAELLNITPKTVENQINIAIRKIIIVIEESLPEYKRYYKRS